MEVNHVLLKRWACLALWGVFSAEVLRVVHMVCLHMAPCLLPGNGASTANQAEEVGTSSSPPFMAWALKVLRWALLFFFLSSRLFLTCLSWSLCFFSVSPYLFLLPLHLRGVFKLKNHSFLLLCNLLHNYLPYLLLHNNIEMGTNDQRFLLLIFLLLDSTRQAISDLDLYKFIYLWHIFFNKTKYRNLFLGMVGTIVFFFFKGVFLLSASCM